MNPLELMKTVTDENQATLICQEHEDYWVDAEGVPLPDLLRTAQEHIKRKHRVHVTRCLCSPDEEDRVIDGRCVPRTS